MKKISLAIYTVFALSSASVYADNNAAAPAAAEPATTASTETEAAAMPAAPSEAAAPVAVDAKAATPEATPTPVALQAADIEAGKAKAVVCGACHGADGNSMVPIFPNLAGQHQGYIFNQLKAFKAEERKDPSMAPQVAALNEQDMLNLSTYFAAQSLKPNAAAKANMDGESIYKGGNAANKVAACMACHGPNGAGNATANYPALKGQQAGYTEKQLKAFKAGTRAASTNAQIMRDIASRMSDKEIAAVSAHIASMK